MIELNRLRASRQVGYQMSLHKTMFNAKREVNKTDILLLLQDVTKSIVKYITRKLQDCPKSYKISTYGFDFEESNQSMQFVSFQKLHAF